MITFQQIHKFINLDWNKEELPERWKESIVVPICKKGNKTDCSNYCVISLLSASHKILSNSLPSRLSPCTVEIIGDNQCWFQHNRSTTDQNFCIRQLLEKKWEYNVTVHHLFTDFDSVRREVLYNFLIEFGVPMKLVWLIKTCSNETCGKVHMGKHLSDSFPIQNGTEQGDALSPLLFNFALEYAIRKVQETRWDQN
jgi:hypothetical protein